MLIKDGNTGLLKHQGITVNEDLIKTIEAHKVVPTKRDYSSLFRNTEKPKNERQ